LIRKTYILIDKLSVSFSWLHFALLIRNTNTFGLKNVSFNEHSCKVTSPAAPGLPEGSSWFDLC
jgi:hypothetical protein